MMSDNQQQAAEPAATDQAMMLQIMVTEHSALQTARSATIFDANGRVSLYIGAISSALIAIALIAIALIAIALIGQVSEMGDAFYIVTLVLLPPLFFIGLVTSERTLQISIEDAIYARNMNRIRHYFTEIAPETARYFLLSIHDDTAGFRQNLGARRGIAQIFLSTSGLVSGINSLLLGVFFAILAHLLFGLELIPCTIIAAFGLVISFVVYTRYQTRRWNETETRLPVLFPSPESDESQS